MRLPGPPSGLFWSSNWNPFGTTDSWSVSLFIRTRWMSFLYTYLQSWRASFIRHIDEKGPRIHSDRFLLEVFACLLWLGGGQVGPKGQSLMDIYLRIFWPPDKNSTPLSESLYFCLLL